MMSLRVEQEGATQPAHRADEVLRDARATEHQAFESLLTRLKRLSENSTGQPRSNPTSDRQRISQMAAEVPWGSSVIN